MVLNEVRSYLDEEVIFGLVATFLDLLQEF